MNKNKRYILMFSLLSIFLLILYFVINNKFVKFDDFIYNIVSFNKSEFMVNFYKFITFFGSTIFMVSLVILLLLFYKNKKGIYIAITMIGSTLLNNIVKILVKRIRPLELMLVDESSYSFPSGHTMAAVSMYGLLIYLIWCSNASKKAKIIATISILILILLVALSRIYLGAHYASDILGAVVLSLLWLSIIIDIFKMKNIK